MEKYENTSDVKSIEGISPNDHEHKILLSDNTEAKEYPNLTFDIVSKVGYLIGVDQDNFEGTTGWRAEIYKELDQRKDARIIRNLCLIRTRLFRHFMKISTAMLYDLKNIDSFPDIIPVKVLSQLREDGIEVWHANWKINQYLLFVCNEIKKHISDCREIFPIWLEWDFIKDLFVIPGLKEEQQIKSFGTVYQTHLSCYPFQMYIYWEPKELGNILYNDEKFIAQTLYPMHGKSFYDLSKVRDISDQTKGDIKEFIENAEKVDIVVDCENANPYKVYAMLRNLPTGTLHKIQKIILYNDIHASSAWKLLNQFVSGVEHQMIDRVKSNKSLVDISLAVGACKEHYENGVDSFVLVSSDSDYWGLIQGVPQCNFLVLVEKGHTSPSVLKAMDGNDIPYVFIDQFYTGNLENIQAEAVLVELRASLSHYEIDMDALFRHAMERTMVQLSEREITSLKKRFLKKIQIVQEDGLIKFNI